MLIWLTHSILEDAGTFCDLNTCGDEWNAEKQSEKEGEKNRPWSCNCGWHHFAELYTDKMKRMPACKHSIIMHSVGITSLYNRHYNLTADGSFIETKLIWHQIQKSSQRMTYSLYFAHSWFRCILSQISSCLSICANKSNLYLSPWNFVWAPEYFWPYR